MVSLSSLVPCDHEYSVINPIVIIGVGRDATVPRATFVTLSS